MNTFFTEKFRKVYKKRILPHYNLDKRFEERRKLFINNRFHPLLKDHALTGSKKGFRAFWVTGDIRVIYYIKGNTAYLIDIGSHNQVY